MNRTSISFLAASFAAFVGTIALAVPASAAVTQQQIRASIVRDLAGNVVHVHDVRDLGHEFAATPVRVALLMRVRNEAELRQLVTLQSDAGFALLQEVFDFGAVRAIFLARSRNVRAHDSPHASTRLSYHADVPQSAA